MSMGTNKVMGNILSLREATMKANGTRIRSKDLADKSLAMVMFTQVSGKTTQRGAMGSLSYPVSARSMANSPTTKSTDMGSTHGKMDGNSQAGGIGANNMVLGYKPTKRVSNSSASGIVASLSNGSTSNWCT